ncbi:diguanylate cyclase/phosphodiesterase (GGDEF & EAL domains) with PAS/PAC sensor(s) [Methylomonas albis]|uniref:EAL domain-containing protein n=1 Tax=Methylomonas albis TaxID=1854563 RepID=A0ABR9D9M6_9GAMM|nr:EAL domain-containing protein [Methylomonas albis]MBD9358914.1 EAL domain-containing protein [Methylomonas albis]CAD6882395.1 diguanylate cyclase/phosphodiesterase (GGDEF & EAL domains) with PAS/PAC sensor(s) [Methylomonas albis]
MQIPHLPNAVDLSLPELEGRNIAPVRPLVLLMYIGVLTLLMLAGGWMGVKMIIPPGYASPLWPAAGIALAALFIGGRYLWLGVWLGAALSNFLAAIDFSGQLTTETVISCFVIGAGSTLQALAATALVRAYIEPGLPKLDSPGTILKFFVLVGPVACLIAPSIGIVMLYSLDLMSSSELWWSWRNWWVGDSLGVIIVTPLLFCYFGRPHALWQARRLSVALPLLGTLLALVLVFLQVFQAERARIQQVFDSRASEIERLLVEYKVDVIDSTLALRDVFLASNDVSRAEFTVFSQGILQRHPEIQALEWLPRIVQADLPAFEQAIRAEGFSNFQVTERDGSGQLVKATARTEYFPIMFVEPMAGNEKAFGFDSISNPLSREAKNLARASGKPSASQKLILMQRGDVDPGILVSIPVSRHSAAGDALDIAGFVSAIILPTRMVEIVTKGLNLDALGIGIDDLSAPIGQTGLFAKPVRNPVPLNYPLRKWQHSFPFVDRNWQITITPDSLFINEQGSSLPLITLIGGLCFTSLLSILLLIISGRTASVQALVEERTQALADAVAELQVSANIARESELKLRTIVDSEPECVKLLARDGSLLQMNRAGLDMIEADTLEQAQQGSMENLVQPKYREAFNRLNRRVFSGASGTLEFELVGLKGRQLWLDTHAVPMRDAEGNITALLGLTRDITERKQAEEHLKLAARVFSEAHEGILITDATATIIDVNPTFCEITGYSRKEVIGRNPSMLQSGKYAQDFYRDMWQALREAQHWQGELWNRKKNGELYAEWLTVSALCDGYGNVTHYIGLFSDVTQAKQQQQLLELLAHYDPLTRLPNRILFADRLNQAIAHSKREKSLLAICFLDLDGFKPVNDQFGHDVGDRVLVEVAERIKNAIRAEDSVSRHGGDEFALLLGDVESIEQCEQAIMRIHQAIAQPYLIGDQPISVGASSGFTVYPPDNADADALLRHADYAMYQAKLAGKNRCQRFDANRDQQIMHRHQQLRDIEAAFLNNEFCMYYQPKVDIKTGRVKGVEALIRWQHPQRGMVPPLEFLPVIASTDLEIRIGNWVIAQACEQLAGWHARGLLLEVSVNISSYHLLWSGIGAYIESTLQSHPEIDASYLQLEILESTALDDLSAVNRIIKSCRQQLGISVALDDFGTGYSSLTHLRHLSVDTVKIDQTFVRDMLDDPDDYAIIESVIDLSKAFNREVVAEGVESQEQGIVLLLLGCRVLQGYAIARPMPAAAIGDWVIAYQPFSDWQFYADAELSAKQIAIAIRRFDTRQWLQRVQACLFAEPRDAVKSWPIMEQRRTHLGRWLKRAQQDRQYGQDWLERIEQLQRQLHVLAESLLKRYEAGQREAAQAGFNDLRAIQQQIDDLLVLYTPLPDL